MGSVLAATIGTMPVTMSNRSADLGLVIGGGPQHSGGAWASKRPDGRECGAAWYDPDGLARVVTAWMAVASAGGSDTSGDSTMRFGTRRSEVSESQAKPLSD